VSRDLAVRTKGFVTVPAAPRPRRSPDESTSSIGLEPSDDAATIAVKRRPADSPSCRGSVADCATAAA